MQERVKRSKSEFQADNAFVNRSRVLLIVTEIIFLELQLILHLGYHIF